jgi:ribosomal protein S18 acetylase RimI-like enzyme
MLNSESSHGDAVRPAPTLRLATTDDARLLAAAAARFFADTFGAANRPDDLDSYLAEAFSETQQLAELSAPDTRLLLAMDEDDHIVGYVHVRLDAPPPPEAFITREPAAEIARLYADRDWHGHGLGKLLMDAAVETARAAGADVLWLGVWEHNARAIGFYAKMGFQIVGAKDFVLGNDRQRDHVMVLRLTGEV